MQVGAGTKEFEKPKSGLYTGVLADIVDLGLVQGKYGSKPKIRLVWLLNAKDSEGNYFRVMQQVTPVMSEKATLRGIVRDILGEYPPIPYELENLIGKNARLVISTEEAADKKTYANIKAIIQLEPGTPAFAIPQGFVRAQDKPKNGYQPQAQAQQSAPASPAPVAAAPAPATKQNDAIPF
jgi:hypothetical protein